MTGLTSAPVPLSPPPGLVPYRIPVETYEAMVASGVFTRSDRLELIEGILVKKMTKGRKHSAGSEKSYRAIDRALPGGWHARAEKPVRLPTRDSMPEPDISVVRGEPDDYLDLDPGPDDVALVVEVSDSTIVAVRIMATTYGGGPISAYWVVNAIDRQIEVYANPVDGVYPPPIIVPETGAVDLIIDGQVVAGLPAADLLPRRH
jgi:Uma2 family endonuclease